jgi:hypothetical protein
VTPALGATARRATGVMVLEGAKYFIFMAKENSKAFATKSEVLADAAVGSGRYCPPCHLGHADQGDSLMPSYTQGSVPLSAIAL